MILASMPSLCPSSRKNHLYRFAAFLIFATTAWGCQPADPFNSEDTEAENELEQNQDADDQASDPLNEPLGENGLPPAEPTELSLLVVDVLERRADKQVCAAQERSLIQNNTDNIHRWIGTLLPPDAVDALPDVLDTTLIPLVDGSLPTQTAATADAWMARLLDNKVDPNRHILRTLLQLAQAEGPLVAPLSALISEWMAQDENLETARSLLALLTTEVASSTDAAALFFEAAGQWALQPIQWGLDAAQTCGISPQRLLAPLLLAGTDPRACPAQSSCAGGLEAMLWAGQALLESDAWPHIETLLPNLYASASGHQEAFRLLLERIFAVAQDPGIAVWLQRWAEVLQDDPRQTDLGLSLLAQVLQAIELGDLSPAGVELWQIVEGVLPLLRKVFAEQNPEILLAGLLTLGDDITDVQTGLHNAMAYATPPNTDRCGGASEDASAGRRVDPNQPRFYTDATSNQRVDNRSALERGIELLALADCGTVPFSGGQSIAQWLTAQMSGLEPDTVCSLSDGLFDVLGIGPSIGEWLSVRILNLMSCDGQALWDGFQDFPALVSSGALDAALPLASAFAKAGQTEALLELIHLAAQDLQASDASPTTLSAIRQMQPALASFMAAGGAEPIFGLLDILGATPADISEPEGPSLALTLTQTLYRSLSPSAQGDPAPMNLLAQAGKAWAMHMLLSSDNSAVPPKHAIDGILAAAVDALAPAIEGEPLLEQAPNLLPAAIAWLREVLNWAGTEQSNCSVDGIFSPEVYHPNIQQLGLLLETWRNHSERDALDNIALNLLQNPTTRSNMAELLTTVLRAQIPTAWWPTWIEFAQAALIPPASVENASAGGSLLEVAHEVLARDTQAFWWSMAQRMLRTSPGSQKPMIQEVASLGLDVWRLNAPQCDLALRAFSLAEAESTTTQIRTFLNDQTYGLPSILRLMAAREDNESP